MFPTGVNVSGRYRLLPLRRLPYGGVSARPGPGYASHLAVTHHHAPGGIDGGRGQHRQGERVVDRPRRVDVETRQVERCAEALGRAVAADERSVTEQTAPAPASTLYLGMDGTGVPVRPAEGEDRRGKQPDGSAKTREVKLATVWTAEGRDTQGRPVAPRDRPVVRKRPAAGRCLGWLRRCMLSGRFEEFWERRAANAA